MTPSLPDGVWPEDGLEHLQHCPVCGSAARTILFNDLVDDSFRVAPGKWSLWRCSECTNAYLDPRPSRASIGKAYSSYYTHADQAAGAPLGRLARMRNAIGNGYRNRRFGAHLKPEIRSGYWFTRMLPRMRTRVDATYRFLPRPGSNNNRLLDFGCGNGAWLALARDAGWKVQGVEPDPASAAIAIERGIPVARTLEDLSDRTFDWITMNHVVEHLHDPIGTLESLAGLIRPGGGLSLETPNVDALGRVVYGRHWRGLEAPRHLVLFTVAGLTSALRKAGFVNIRMHPQRHVWRGMSIESERMRQGMLPGDASISVTAKGYGMANRMKQRLDSSRTEFITLTCERPC